MGFTDLHAMNGLKNILSVLLSTASALTSRLPGSSPGTTPSCSPGPSATAGGFVGAHYARRLRYHRAPRGHRGHQLAMTAAFLLA